MWPGAASRELLRPWFADAVIDKGARTLTLSTRCVPATMAFAPAFNQGGSMNIVSTRPPSPPSILLLADAVYLDQLYSGRAKFAPRGCVQDHFVRIFSNTSIALGSPDSPSQNSAFFRSAGSELDVAI